MTLAAGSRLGPYEIVSQLAHGGMGVVYLATDPRLRRTVAIKLLPPDLTKDETAKQRFLQEAIAASALDHPNICNIHEINETGEGQLYLVMAHYEGETLKERIGRGPLALGDAIDIATQVGEGLAEAHKAGIIHRDIKPANLLVTKTGVVKILDFGLAKLAGTEGVTQTGTTVGTVAYMSPEQAKGQEVDHRTDIWSLGVVLYEMLAGTPPFAGENLLSLSNAIMDGEPVALSGASSSANSVVTKALSKNKSQRHQAVADLLKELRALQSSDAATVETPAKADVPSIAVLAFADMSPGKDQDYFCEGMAEEIINALTSLDGLRVSARTSSFKFKGKDLDATEIGTRLKVGSILEGSVRKAGDRLRITAQLINVSDGFHLWSQRYDRDMDDIFAVQDDIARTVVEKLRVKLLGAAYTPLVKRPTDNLKAYNLVNVGDPPALPGRPSVFDVSGSNVRNSPREPLKHHAGESSMNNYRSLNHTKWECQYHVVFIPEYRRKTLYGGLRHYLGDVLRRLAEQRESRVEEGHLLADHVHMLVSIPPKYSVAQVIGYIKGKSAIHIAREFAGRPRNFVGQHFWARGYYVSTVGQDERVVREYVQQQEREDRRLEQLRLEE